MRQRQEGSRPDVVRPCRVARGVGWGGAGRAGLASPRRMAGAHAGEGHVTGRVDFPARTGRVAVSASLRDEIFFSVTLKIWREVFRKLIKK